MHTGSIRAIFTITNWQRTYFCTHHKKKLQKLPAAIRQMASRFASFRAWREQAWEASAEHDITTSVELTELQVLKFSMRSVAFVTKARMAESADESSRMVVG